MAELSSNKLIPTIKTDVGFCSCMKIYTEMSKKKGGLDLIHILAYLQLGSQVS